MVAERIDELHAIRVFLDEQRANGVASLTLCEALDLREIRNASDKKHETAAAIRGGFADIVAGSVKPVREP